MVLSYDDCWVAATNVLNALSDIGETWSCLVGGMAARLHGVNRVVKVRLPFQVRIQPLTRIRTWI